MSNLSELKRIASEGGADVSNVKSNEEALALIGGSGSGSGGVFATFYLYNENTESWCLKDNSGEVVTQQMLINASSAGKIIAVTFLDPDEEGYNSVEFFTEIGTTPNSNYGNMYLSASITASASDSSVTKRNWFARSLGGTVNWRS